MIAKILTAALFVTLAAGAAYSYNELHFGDRTTAFFSRVLGSKDQTAAYRRRPSGDLQSIERSSRRTSMETRREMRPRRFSGDFRERRSHGRRSSVISLENVFYYTCILSFVVMVVYQSENLVRRLKSTRQG